MLSKAGAKIFRIVKSTLLVSRNLRITVEHSHLVRETSYYYSLDALAGSVVDEIHEDVNGASKVRINLQRISRNY